MVKKIDINKLDKIELITYNRLIKHGLTSKNALQIIINTVEGDYRQLSQELRRYKPILRS